MAAVIKIGWAWRYKGVKSPRKSLSLILLELIHLLAFGAAGILLSHATTLSNEVLLARSPNCDIWLPGGTPTNLNLPLLTELTAYSAYLQGNTQLSKEYVDDCLQQSQSLPECKTFKCPQLKWTSTNQAPCPFSSGMCLGPVNGSLEIDTRLMDSRDDLGINGDDMNRVQYRRLITCIPITSQGYIENGSLSSNGMTFNYSAAFAGPMKHSTLHRRPGGPFKMLLISIQTSKRPCWIMTK